MRWCDSHVMGLKRPLQAHIPHAITYHNIITSIEYLWFCAIIFSIDVQLVLVYTKRPFMTNWLCIVFFAFISLNFRTTAQGSITILINGNWTAVHISKYVIMPMCHEIIEWREDMPYAIAHLSISLTYICAQLERLINGH